LETFFRLFNIEHKVLFDGKKGPKGKWPWVEVGGSPLSDSAYIMEWLRADRSLPPAFPPSVPAERVGAVHALLRMLEEATYFNLMWFRWVDEEGWADMSAEYFADFSWIVRSIAVPYVVRRSVVNALHAQGTGRHDRTTVARALERDIDALAAILGERPYIFGDEMSDADCTVFAFVAAFLTPTRGVMQAAILKHNNLVAYYDRIVRKLYPENENTSDKIVRV
jgi:glutathione S-transferase